VWGNLHSLGWPTRHALKGSERGGELGFLVRSRWSAGGRYKRISPPRMAGMLATWKIGEEKGDRVIAVHCERRVAPPRLPLILT
jgi:hypothetical protein